MSKVTKRRRRTLIVRRVVALVIVVAVGLAVAYRYYGWPFCSYRSEFERDLRSAHAYPRGKALTFLATRTDFAFDDNVWLFFRNEVKGTQRALRHLGALDGAVKRRLISTYPMFVEFGHISSGPNEDVHQLELDLSGKVRILISRGVAYLEKCGGPRPDPPTTRH